MNWLRNWHPRRSLAARLTLTNLALILLALSGLVVGAGWQLQRSLTAETIRGLELQAAIMANGLAEPWVIQLDYEESHESEEEDEHKRFVTYPSGRDFETILSNYVFESDSRIVVFDTAAVIRYASDAAIPLGMSDPRDDVMAALQGEAQHTTRNDPISGEDRVYVTMPITTGTKILGAVEVSKPVSQVFAQVNRVWVLLLSISGIVLLLTLAVSILLARYITQPVSALNQAAQEFAQGNLQTRINLSREDELGQLAASFNYMAAEISHLLAQERAFVANASHELRSPLAAIQLRAELLQTPGVQDPARIRRYLQEIERESQHLSQLLTHLLQLHRAESRPPDENPRCDPILCIQHVAELMQPIAQDAKIHLHIDIPPTSPPARLSSEECELVIRNLVDNAIKYTPAQGDVWIQAEAGASDVLIRVRDNGQGIPADELSHIFDRFYRVNKARDRTGAGLGLSLVKAIVDRCEGAIDVQSVEDQGTTITLSFPLAP